ncbi:MAG: EamA family transporter [Clostridia bacterium]|nr:EamA family transporter [Clostridia bacterium]
MFIISLYLSIILLSGAQSLSVKLYNRQHEHDLLFNVVRAAAALFMFILIGINGFSFHLPTLAYGVAFGALLCIATYCGHKALSCGPLSMTSPLVAYSLIIPTIYGIAFKNEPFTTNIIIGLICLLVSIVLFAIPVTKNADKNEKNTTSFRWIVYVAITFLCNGFNSVLQKEYQSYYSNAYNDEFMIYAMALSLFVFGGMFFSKKDSLTVWKQEKGKGYAVFAGVANGGANFLTLYLAKIENASVMYPIISAGSLLMAMLCGVIIFREKQTISRIFAFVLGVTAAVFLKI